MTAHGGCWELKQSAVPGIQVAWSGTQLLDKRGSSQDQTVLGLRWQSKEFGSYPLCNGRPLKAFMLENHMTKYECQRQVLKLGAGGLERGTMKEQKQIRTVQEVPNIFQANYAQELNQGRGSRNGEVGPDLGQISEIKRPGFKNMWMCHFVVMQRAVWERKALKRTMGRYSEEKSMYRRQKTKGLILQMLTLMCLCKN